MGVVHAAVCHPNSELSLMLPIFFVSSCRRSILWQGPVPTLVNRHAVCHPSSELSLISVRKILMPWQGPQAVPAAATIEYGTHH